MSGRSVEHATFVVERTYDVSPQRAFAAWADPEAKARWFVAADARLELDFRVGGRERSRGTAPDGNAFSYEALYQDIVPAERIVYTYDMHLQETRISVSLATVEFRAVGGNGTRLVFTEQGAFLDGHEHPARRAEGLGSLLDALEKAVQGEAPGSLSAGRLSDQRHLPDRDTSERAHNAGAAPVRFLNFNTPAGSENYMRELGEAAKAGPLTPDVIGRIASHYDFQAV